MNTEDVPSATLNGDIWLTWRAKGILHEKAMARKARLFTGIVLAAIRFLRCLGNKSAHLDEPVRRIKARAGKLTRRNGRSLRYVLDYMPAL